MDDLIRITRRACVDVLLGIEERVKEQEKTQALVQETRETYASQPVRCGLVWFDQENMG